MKFTKKKLALAIGGALITMSVLVSGCSCLLYTSDAADEL